MCKKKYIAIDEGGIWGQEVRSKMEDVLKNLTPNSRVDRGESDQWEVLCVKPFPLSQPIE